MVPQLTHVAPQEAVEQDVPMWFVAFTSYRGCNPLYQKMLPKGFGHVFAFAHLEGHVLLVDPQEGGILLKKLSLPGGQRYGAHLSVFVASLQACFDDITCVHVSSRSPQNTKHLSMFFPSCVTAIKAILCRQSWALTPKGLYKTLLKDGASRVDTAYLNQLRNADISARKNQHDKKTIRNNNLKGVPHGKCV